MNSLLSLRSEELADRLKWLIHLRWTTIVFIIIAYLTATLVFDLIIEPIPLFIIIIVIAAYNALFYLYVKLKSDNIKEMAGDVAFIQSILDIAALALFIYFTGGLENPFIFYFIFHTIITSILLPKERGVIQAFLICILIGLIGLLEYKGLIAHHPIGGFITGGLYKNLTYVFVVYFTFASTILISTFITISISERLSRKELELKRVSRELEGANLKLIEKDRLKSEYVMMVAHDIKSPISSIVSMIDVVLEGFAGSMDDKIKDLLSRIRQKIVAVHNYVSDLLNISRIRSSKVLNLERLRIRGLIDEAMDFSSAKGEGKGIEVKIDCPDDIPLVTADREQIRYVFINLLENAFKYTAQGGRVWVKVKSADDGIEAEVGDTGIGIPQEDMPKIFTEFFRGGNVKDSTKGTGLGLALVKYIIERHNGKIWITSESGRGTVFRFTLPLRQ